MTVLLHWPHTPLMALVLSAAACGSPDLTAPSPPHFCCAVPRSGGVDVSGRVIDFITNSGVPNVVVGFGKYGPDLGIATLNDHKTTTDASGVYQLTLPSGEYYIYVDGQIADVFRVRDTVYRGDVFVRSGGCSARYGMIVDARTKRPIAGVRVSLIGFETLSDETGWYRLSMGCFSSYGIGTTFIYFTHSGYADRSMVAGRRETLAGLRRMDAGLQRH